VSSPVDQLAPALDRLGEVLESELDEVGRDAALHRFQVCFELCWKSVQQRLQERELDCASPMGCLQVAVRQGWLVEEPWLEMIESRNHLPSCTDEKITSGIATALPDYLAHMRDLYEALMDST
jgi:Nucleotidyltransferase substrate binding protein like